MYCRVARWMSADVSEEHVASSQALLATCFMLDPCLAYSSTLKMEAICYCEKSAKLQRITRRYNPEDRTHHNHRCDVLKSYIHICRLLFSGICIRVLPYPENRRNVDTYLPNYPASHPRTICIHSYCRENLRYFTIHTCRLGARGSVVGWGTILQVGRSRVRLPMRSLDFFNWPKLSSRTMALGSTQPLTEMSTRNLPGGKGPPAGA
jgi:hypothetical protein